MIRKKVDGSQDSICLACLETVQGGIISQADPAMKSPFEAHHCPQIELNRHFVVSNMPAWI